MRRERERGETALGIKRIDAFASGGCLWLLGPEDDGGFVLIFEDDPSIHDLNHTPFLGGINPKGAPGSREEKVCVAQKRDFSISSAPAEKSFPDNLRDIEVHLA